MTQQQALSTHFIQNYHAHLYYSAENLSEAQQLAHDISSMYEIKVGTFHQKPVGPHPVWSCQLSINPDQFADAIPWLLVNHGTIDVFIHANTGHNLIDHTQHVMWIGKSYDLNISIFQANS